jgi:hypothetical protein
VATKLGRNPIHLTIPSTALVCSQTRSLDTPPQGSVVTPAGSDFRLGASTHHFHEWDDVDQLGHLIELGQVVKAAIVMNSSTSISVQNVKPDGQRYHTLLSPQA